MPKKDAVCAVAALKEALIMCDNRNLRQITASRIVRIQADGGGEFTNQKVRDLYWEKNITLSYSPAHQPSSNGIAERMVGILKSTVRRMLKQAHLDREWWSYACRFAGHMMREKVLGREWPHPLFGQLVGNMTKLKQSHWMIELPSRYRCLAKWFRPYHAGWYSGQRSCTEASRPSKVSPESKDRSQ